MFQIPLGQMEAMLRISAFLEHDFGLATRHFALELLLRSTVSKSIAPRLLGGIVNIAPRDLVTDSASANRDLVTEIAPSERVSIPSPGTSPAESLHRSGFRRPQIRLRKSVSEPSPGRSCPNPSSEVGFASPANCDAVTGLPGESVTVTAEEHPSARPGTANFFVIAMRYSPLSS
jgi:hypothetical protein